MRAGITILKSIYGKVGNIQNNIIFDIQEKKKECVTFCDSVKGSLDDCYTFTLNDQTPYTKNDLHIDNGFFENQTYVDMNENTATYNSTDNKIDITINGSVEFQINPLEFVSEHLEGSTTHNCWFVKHIKYHPEETANIIQFTIEFNKFEDDSSSNCSDPGDNYCLTQCNKTVDSGNVVIFDGFGCTEMAESKISTFGYDGYYTGYCDCCIGTNFQRDCPEPSAGKVVVYGGDSDGDGVRDSDECIEVGESKISDFGYDGYYTGICDCIDNTNFVRNCPEPEPGKVVVYVWDSNGDGVRNFDECMERSQSEAESFGYAGYYTGYCDCIDNTNFNPFF